MSLSTQCLVCIHFHGPGCDAFPDRIPERILSGVFDHRNPYPGDNGVRWELAPGRSDLIDDGRKA